MLFCRESHNSFQSRVFTKHGISLFFWFQGGWRGRSWELSVYGSSQMSEGKDTAVCTLLLALVCDGKHIAAAGSHIPAWDPWLFPDSEKMHHQATWSGLWANPTCSFWRAARLHKWIRLVPDADGANNHGRKKLSEGLRCQSLALSHRNLNIRAFLCFHRLHSFP